MNIEELLEKLPEGCCIYKDKHGDLSLHRLEGTELDYDKTLIDYPYMNETNLHFIQRIIENE